MPSPVAGVAGGGARGTVGCRGHNPASEHVLSKRHGHERPARHPSAADVVPVGGDVLAVFGAAIGPSVAGRRRRDRERTGLTPAADQVAERYPWAGRIASARRYAQARDSRVAFAVVDGSGRLTRTACRGVFSASGVVSFAVDCDQGRRDDRSRSWGPAAIQSTRPPAGLTRVLGCYASSRATCGS